MKTASLEAFVGVSNNSLPLALAPVRTSLKITAITGDEKIQARLADLGIYAEAEIVILQNGYCGPLMVCVKGSRMALGRSLASVIMVEADGDIYVA